MQRAIMCTRCFVNYNFPNGIFTRNYTSCPLCFPDGVPELPHITVDPPLPQGNAQSNQAFVEELLDYEKENPGFTAFLEALRPLNWPTDIPCVHLAYAKEAYHCEKCKMKRCTKHPWRLCNYLYCMRCYKDAPRVCWIHSEL